MSFTKMSSGKEVAATHSGIESERGHGSKEM